MVIIHSCQEGAVFFVIKRLQSAKESGDVIHSVINSLALGHNGGTRTLMTPNPLAQERIARKALKLARVLPGDIDFVEGTYCHVLVV